MIKNITGLEEKTRAVLQMINVLQNNYTKKSEEEKQHLKQVETNWTEKMLEVEQNISRFYEVVQKKNIEINDEKGLSEEILQNNSSKDLRKLYDETDKKIDDQKEKIDELKKKMFLDTERINASIKKLDGDFNEFNRTFVKEETIINGQFTYVKQSISRLLKSVTEMDEKSKKVQEEVDAEKSKVESTMTNIKELTGYINDLKSHNTKTDEDTSEKFRSIGVRVNNIVIMVKDVDMKIDEKAETINKKIDAEKRNAESTMAYAMELEGNLKELHDHTTEREKQVNEKFISIEKKVNELEIKMEQVDKKIDEKAETINKKVDAEKENFESEMAGVHGRLNYFSVELNDINLYIVGFLLLVVVGVIFTAYKILLPKQSPVAVYDQTAAKSAPQPRVGGLTILTLPSEIVEGISRQNLEPGINVISFTSSTQQFHKNLIDAVPKPTSTQIHSCLIHRSSDIPHTTPSKVVFIFVDFNERNIILEDPETEIGDLRRLTTQGLLNMGCDVFVIYVKDRGSQDLPRDQLYSPRLYSVERHPILHKLKEKHRVLSLYDRFHPHQVKFLEDCFKRL
ncbi:putative leucine-rich repeat-containing protein DDB_G0290503 [Saccostrea echinata]|uniref:putative leucine-rich repeat-containing protein DDB_G0290503 n=1 Tax=Saccostrea echinata TaxID=191078 RepID=UPI002A83D721|nr:putative leucine-rich repeat-containing protein DDB_G0290503 [Saccostrea echinata]